MLVLDVGNTKTVLCRLSGEVELLGKWSSHCSIEKLVESVGKLVSEPLTVVSVIPEISTVLEKEISPIFFADHSCNLPFNYKIKNIENTGADRICNMAALHGIGIDTAMVIDAGTATTFDILLKGEFIGGLIAPGMSTAAKALSLCTAQLSDVRLDKCELKVGTDTETSMRAGSYHTGIHGVMGTAWALTTKYGKMPIILTGGLSEMLDEVRIAAEIGGDWIQDKWWTLRGAAFLANTNRGV